MFIEIGNKPIYVNVQGQGEDDPHVPPCYAQMIPARSLTIVPNCGHWVPQEAPEVYEKVILNP